MNAAEPAFLQTEPAFLHQARLLDLRPGESLRGILLRLPQRGIPHGTRLFILTEGDGPVALLATKKAGWLCFERALVREDPQPGDLIEVRFRGWRSTLDGLRRYRDVDVTILERRGERS